MYGNNRSNDFLVGALIGGTIATLTTLLFTTKQGKKIKDKIVDTFEDLEETAKDVFSDAKDKAEDAVDHVRKKAHNDSHGHHKKKEKDSD